MTLEEFDALKPGDTVIIADMQNGKKITYPPWLQCVGMSVVISGEFVHGLPGGAGYWPATSGHINWAFTWPDNIDLPGKSKNVCECGAHAVGIKSFMPGHSRWCPGRQNVCRD